MKITVCIGSYCHVKGSRYIIERIHQLITEKNLTNRKEQLDMKESELQKRQEAFEKKYHQALEEPFP